jgi:hypothetical protein
MCGTIFVNRRMLHWGIKIPDLDGRDETLHTDIIGEDHRHTRSGAV